MQDKSTLKEQLNNIRKKIDEFYENNLSFDELTRLELDSLYAEYYKIYDRLQVMDYKFVIGNDVVDLCKKDPDYFEGEYIICLHNTLTKIGDIDYRPGDWFMGNIGYKIKESFRGKNYAYHATCLLFNVLYLNGVNDTVITSYTDNIASIMIMNKLKEFDLECEITEDKDNNVIRYHYKFDKELNFNNSLK